MAQTMRTTNSSFPKQHCWNDDADGCLTETGPCRVTLLSPQPYRDGAELLPSPPKLHRTAVHSHLRHRKRTAPRYSYLRHQNWAVPRHTVISPPYTSRVAPHFYRHHLVSFTPARHICKVSCPKFHGPCINCSTPISWLYLYIFSSNTIIHSFAI